MKLNIADHVIYHTWKEYDKQQSHTNLKILDTMLTPTINNSFLRFILVGIISAIVDISFLWAGLMGGMHYGLAVSFGYAVGIVTNYFLHATYTFKVKKKSMDQLIGFLVIVGFNYSLTLIIVWFLHGVIYWHVMFAKLASLPIVAINGYYWSRRWVFRLQ